MKKIALFTALCSLSVAGYSADWTPVFQSWEYGEDSHIIELIQRDISSSSNDGLGISWSARNGNYESVPARYRADMLPARLTLDEEGMTITIPLKNAILYGLPIRSISYYHIPETASASTYVTFHSLTNAEYQNLKRKKFANTGEEGCGGGAEVLKNDDGEVILTNYWDC